MRVRERVPVERGAEIPEGFGFLGGEAVLPDERQACEAGVEEGKDAGGVGRGGCGGELAGAVVGGEAVVALGEEVFEEGVGGGRIRGVEEGWQDRGGGERVEVFGAQEVGEVFLGGVVDGGGGLGCEGVTEAGGSDGWEGGRG